MATTLIYFAGQMVGATLGAVFAWLSYKQHFDAEPDPAAKLGVFSTGPAIRSKGWNMVTEIIATFVLVFVVILFANTPSGLGPLAVALLVVGIGASLGGPTGYAINPARDLGPASPTPCCPSRARAPATGATPGSPSSDPSSAAPSQGSPHPPHHGQRRVIHLAPQHRMT